MKAFSHLTLLLPGMIWGCGSVPAVPDALSVSDAREVMPDAVPCTVLEPDYSFDGVSPVLMGNLRYDSNANYNSVVVVVALIPARSHPTTDYLVLQHFTKRLPFDQGFVAGTYQISGAQTQYASCGLCALVNSAFDGTSYTGDTFLASSGTVTITQAGNAIGETWAFEVTDLVFKQITVNTSSISTFVNPGCETKLAKGSYTGTLGPPPAQ
jgi:hypothetical protein